MTADLLARPSGLGERGGRVIGMVSTWPPTQCGLATFASALSRAMTEQGDQVVPVDVQPAGSLPHHTSLIVGDPLATLRVQHLLDGCDAVILQHEFGIFGGSDGVEVLDLLDGLRAPLVVVLHTVPAEPTPAQSHILVSLCSRADTVVVMANAAKDRLAVTYDQIDLDRVVVIPHGARLARDSSDGASARPRLLTWGLLGPGKGVEHVVGALGRLHAEGLDVPYTVAGVTHPNVLAREGEAYREGLVALAESLDVGHLVAFDNAYRTPEEITASAAAASVIVLPYDADDQITSGVLVDAIAAGRPVISTRFPHSVELLSDGAGIVVPNRDPKAMADAIRSLVTRPRRLARMTRRARELAPSLSWGSVARQYGTLCASVASRV